MVMARRSRPRRCGHALALWLGRAFNSRDPGVELTALGCSVSLAVFLFLEIYTVVALAQPFKPFEFGGGIAGIFSAFAAGALGQGGQRRLEGTDPPAPPPPT